MKSDDDDAVPESLPLRLTHPVSDSPSAARADGDPLHPAEVYPTQPDMVHLYEVSWDIYGGRVTYHLSVAGIQEDKKVPWHGSWSNAGICPNSMAKLGFEFFPKKDFCVKLLCKVSATEAYPLSAKASRAYALGGRWTEGKGDAPDRGWDVLAVRGGSEEELAGYVHEDGTATLYFYLLDKARETLIDDPSTDAFFRWYEKDGEERSSVKWRYEESQVVETP